MGRPPIYVRANTPLPLWPPMLHDGAAQADPLTWLIFVAQADAGTGAVYDDRGEGFAFENGDFARFSVTCRTTPALRLQLSAQQGSFIQSRSTVEFDIRGAGRPNQITANGSVLNDWEYTNSNLLIRLPATPIATEIEIA
jgi:alpha-glucosidase